ncbi:hypothetical protein [Paenibacillus flagellatus]|uniref:Uncharacterized protein n=1 Tax=Paenibacillus flagellatus TaxID=2211139 RepID=A0A2V5K0A0_9BACL|nr:hypothetical protein [Paenibacillus flagellatus]PYI52558.1 hypothetical protein DLM86_20510 [Paenibacillus flagellatus]
MQDTQLFTWTALLTIGGASLLTFYIVQYTKILVDRVLRKWRVPTDVYAVAVAWVVLLAAQFAIGTEADWRTYFLAFANAFLVAAAAGQIQNKSIHPPGGDAHDERT